MNKLKEKQEKEFDKIFVRNHNGFDCVQAFDIQDYHDFISKVRKESIEFERERIKKIIKEMPDTFPELESDSYDEAYKDAKRYMLANT